MSCCSSSGCQESRGCHGKKGERGKRGHRGAIGPTGPQGEMGVTGANGLKGPTGPQGEIGVSGPTGLQGPTGSLSGPAGGDLMGTYPNPTIRSIQSIPVTSPNFSGPTGTFMITNNIVNIGKNNTAFGVNALKDNSTGERNCAFGSNTLNSNVNGNFNTAMGDSALELNTFGTFNSSFGSGSLGINTTGNTNTAIGANALGNNTIGFGNTAVGTFAIGSFGGLDTTGNNNSAFGLSANAQNTTGIGNCSFGSASNFFNQEDSEISSFGTSTGVHFKGNTNTFLGYKSGFNSDISPVTFNGNNNTCLGANSFPSGDVSNEVTIGDSLVSNYRTGTNLPIVTPRPGNVHAANFNVPLQGFYRVDTSTDINIIGSFIVDGVTLTITSVSGGLLLPGMVLSGGDITPTSILLQTTGITGGPGDYQVNDAQLAGVSPTTASDGIISTIYQRTL